MWGFLILQIRLVHVITQKFYALTYDNYEADPWHPISATYNALATSPQFVSPRWFERGEGRIIQWQLLLHKRLCQSTLQSKNMRIWVEVLLNLSLPHHMQLKLPKSWGFLSYEMVATSCLVFLLVLTHKTWLHFFWYTSVVPTQHNGKVLAIGSISEHGRLKWGQREILWGECHLW